MDEIGYEDYFYGDGLCMICLLYTSTTENAAVIIAGSKIGMEIGMFQTDRRVDRDFYIMGWCAAGIFAALFL